MVEILKMKHGGCCFNCLSALGEKQIYRIETKTNFKIELFRDCMEIFIKEMNEKYKEMVGGSNVK